MGIRKGNQDAADRTLKCQWVRCRSRAETVYLGDGLCWEHWETMCAQQERAKKDPAFRDHEPGPCEPLPGQLALWGEA